MIPDGTFTIQFIDGSVGGVRFYLIREPNVANRHRLLLLGFFALTLALPCVGLAADGGDPSHCAIDPSPISTMATWIVGAMAVLAFCVRRR